MGSLLIGSMHPFAGPYPRSGQKSRSARSQATDSDAHGARGAGRKRIVGLAAYASAKAKCRAAADGLEPVPVRPSPGAGARPWLGEGAPLAAAVDLQLHQ